MPPLPPRKPRSCVEILSRLDPKASWDDYLARIAAAAEDETATAAPKTAEEREALETSEALQIAKLRRRLGLD